MKEDHSFIEQISKIIERMSISLRDYFEAKIENIEKSTDLARKNLEIRLEGMNEFRETIRDQANKLMPRGECATKHETLDLIINKINDDIRYLREEIATTKGKSFIANIIAIVGVIVSLIVLFKGMF